MRIGVVFPQTEIGSDPAAIRDYAQTAEGLGFTHVLAYDHVLGANPDRPEGFTGPYTYQTPFHEVFVLFSYLAGLTQRMEFVTGILILPQRQTALVAKQAASLDVLSGGRLRLGVGLGWNKVEYIGLNENFHNRGKRIEEQAHVVTSIVDRAAGGLQGEMAHHSGCRASTRYRSSGRSRSGLAGGMSERYAAPRVWLMDGCPISAALAEAKPGLDLLNHFLEEAGRSRREFGLEPRIAYGAGDPKTWETSIRDWDAEGATHLSFNTMGSGFKTPQEHIQAIRKFALVVLK